MPVATGLCPQGQQRLSSVHRGLTNAHEEPGGERDVEPASVLNHLQPHLGVFIWRPVVHTTWLRKECCRGGFQHHAHAGRHRPKPLHFLPTHHPRVEVRQQPGVFQYADRCRANVIQGGFVARLLQPLARGRPASLRSVPQREERLGTPQISASPRYRHNFFERQEWRQTIAAQRRWIRGEGAVVATVTAQAGQRNEDFGRVGQHA